MAQLIIYPCSALRVPHLISVHSYASVGINLYITRSMTLISHPGLVRREDTLSENVGHTITFRILTDDTKKVINRYNVRSAGLPLEYNLRLDPLMGRVRSSSNQHLCVRTVLSLSHRLHPISLIKFLIRHATTSTTPFRSHHYSTAYTICHTIYRRYCSSTPR